MRNEGYERVVGLLGLQQVDQDTYRASTTAVGPGRVAGARLFGGQIASQALRAAANAVQEVLDRPVDPARRFGLRLNGGRE
ncbi:MAG: hypothetical protein ACRD0R_16645 [Acidimicrobiales bacterium]